MCDRLKAADNCSAAHESACYFGSGTGQPMAQRALLEQFPYARGYLANTGGNRAPTFSGGQGAWADVNSSLRPCYERVPAGSVDSLRSVSTPMSISMQPQHYDWTIPDNLAKQQIHTRVEQAKCDAGPKCQVRSHI